MSDSVGRTQHNPPGPLRGTLEIASIFVLLPLGGILGGLTGFIPLSAIGAIVLPLLAATLFLRREGVLWRDLVFGRPLPPLQVLGFTGLALALVLFAVTASNAVLRAMGFPPADVSVFTQLLEGDLVIYLWFLLPVSWGSAAIGEELLMRGYLLHRLEGLAGTAAAVVLQALIFALAHFYQGITGVVNIFVLALLFGLVYLRSGRNLLPLILAHGLIDTFSMTALYLGRSEYLLGQ